MALPSRKPAESHAAGCFYTAYTEVFMASYAVSATTKQNDGRRNSVDIDVEAFKNRCDWFVTTSTSDGQQRVCTKENFEEILREHILACRLRVGQVVRVYSKKGGIWEESPTSLREFAQKHSKLRALYEPIRGRALTGYWWGLLAGIGLSMLNSIIFYGMTNRWVATCLVAAVAATLIPRVGKTIAPLPFGLLGLTGEYAASFGTLGAAIMFAFLGGISGMAIGGAIGWAWEDKLSRAPDAPAEVNAALLSVLLPLVGSLLLWSAYFFILYPWAVHIVGSPATFWRTHSQP